MEFIQSLIGIGIFLYIAAHFVVIFYLEFLNYPYAVMTVVALIYAGLGYSAKVSFKNKKNWFYLTILLIVLVFSFVTVKVSTNFLLQTAMILEFTIFIVYTFLITQKHKIKNKFNLEHSHTVLETIIFEEVKLATPVFESFSKTDFRDIHSLLLDEVDPTYLKPAKNSEFVVEAERFLKKIEPLNINYSNKHFNSVISNMFGQLKGASGERLATNKINGTGKKFISNAVIKSSEGQAEIDAIVFGKNKIYTFECKDYSAKKIILDSSGYLYKIKNNDTEERIEVLSQIERHNRIIKSAFGQEIQIINTIIITDRDTKVINQFGSDYLKLFHVDMLSFYVSQIEQGGDELLEVYESVKGIERSFQLPDLEKIESKLKEIIEIELSSISSFIDSCPNTERLFEGTTQKIINKLFEDRSKQWEKVYGYEKIRALIDKEILRKAGHVNQSIQFKNELLARKQILEKIITVPQISAEFLAQCNASAELLERNNQKFRNKVNEDI